MKEFFCCVQRPLWYVLAHLSEHSHLILKSSFLSSLLRLCCFYVILSHRVSSKWAAVLPFSVASIHKCFCFSFFPHFSISENGCEQRQTNTFSMVSNKGGNKRRLRFWSFKRPSEEQKDGKNDQCLLRRCNINVIRTLHNYVNRTNKIQWITRAIMMNGDRWNQNKMSRTLRRYYSLDGNNERTMKFGCFLRFLFFLFRCWAIARINDDDENCMCDVHQVAY